MRRPILFFFCFSFLLLRCDDGDVITVELDFDEVEVDTCGEIVFYKEKSSPAETISIQLGSTSIESLISIPEGSSSIERNFTINGTTNRFNYRTYSSLPDDPFCNDIPSSELNITNDDESESGAVNILITLSRDDNDGIPAELEDINGNGDLEDDDTDGDGLPNYIDSDDDGDNILTTAENPNYDETNGLSEAQDTDLDGIPDYLDADDDGDGVLSRDEENFSQDNNPLNDITNVEIGADFLNPAVSNTVTATAYRSHSISEGYQLVITVLGLNLSNFVQDQFLFGTLDLSETITITPEFN